jgi:hypothetical protein
MKPFTLFIEYLQNRVTGSWKQMGPIVVQAIDEEEAARVASGVADVLVPEFTSELTIRVVGNGDQGRPIAEIRRPPSP